MIIGVTGGISTGKSNVSNELSLLGYPIIDADVIAKELQEKDMPVYNAIKKSFGLDYFDSDGNIDRKKLGELIYNDKNARVLLNSVSHPLIIEEIKDRIKKSEGTIFLVVPLLYESGLDSLCDSIICVYVDRKIQVERLMIRDNIDFDYANKKIDSQMNLEEKKAKSDYVIDTSGSLEMTALKIKQILKRIEEKKNGTN